MPVKCLDCDRFSLPASDLRHFGFGACKARPAPGQSMSSEFPRECADFAPAKPDAVAKRVEWLAGCRDALVRKVKAA